MDQIEFYNEIYTCTKCSNVVNNCSRYLKKQLEEFKPKIVFCNGKQVVEWFDANFQSVKNKFETHGRVKVNDNEIRIIYSGFIKRIDNISKRRIRREVLEIVEELKAEDSTLIGLLNTINSK